MKKPLIIITGPTASGKTALSVELAKKVGGEIISADSMQVYRHMDIGSAKVTKEEMDGVRHHLIDVLDPWDEFNVVVFQRLAKQAMEEIYAAGHIPIIAGGTGFYIQALVNDIDFTENDSDTGYREELECLAAEKGASSFHVFWRVMIPMTLPGIISGVTMVFLPAMTNYVVLDMIYNSTYIMGSLIGSYFNAYDWHNGSMISILLLILMFFVTWITDRFAKKQEVEARGGGIW